MDKIIIKLEDIKKEFFLESGKGVEVLKGINLEIKSGDFIALMGESGSGKSTLLNILGCLLTPSSGKYYLDGEDISSLKDDNILSFIRNKKMGYVFQQFHLIPTFNVIENVIIPGIYAGLSYKDRFYKAQDILTKVGLKDKLFFKPSLLSGGQQQRVAIARALLNDTEILLADEPTGALDSNTAVEIMDLLKELNQKGLTILIVTHSKKTAEYASKTLLLKDGSIISE